MARESALWKWLRNAEDRYEDALHMGRVENLVETGWPDVEGHLRGACSFVIELKSTDRPKRPGTRILGPDDVRPDQIPWLQRRWDAGGNAFMLIQVGERHQAKRYLIPGSRLHIVVGACELDLEMNSEVDPRASAAEVVRRASQART